MKIDTEKEIKVTVNHIPYKLSEDDYQGIWSKLWVKILVWCSIVVGLIGALFGFGIYTFAKETVAKSIESYIKGDDFKRHMNVQFEDQVKQANSKLKEIDNGLSKLGIYKAAPYTIEGNTLTTVDAAGRHVILEYGVSNSGKQVAFTAKFQEPPTVILTPYSVIGARNGAISLSEVTIDHFRAHTNNDMLTHKFSWLAIGK